MNNSDNNNGSHSLLYSLALTFSILFMLKYVTLWKFYGEVATYFEYLALLFTTLLLGISATWYKPLYIILSVILVFIIGSNCDQLELLYFSLSLIVGAKGLEFTDILKAHFNLSVSFCLLNIVGSQMGIIENATLMDQSERLSVIDDTIFRESFGYDWCTDFASHVFLIILSLWILKKGVFTKYQLCILLGIAVFILLKTGTRMAAAGIVIIALLSFYIKYRDPYKIPKSVWFFFLASTPFCAILSIYVTMKYDSTDAVWMLTDMFLSGRLSLGQDAILYKGFPWLGQVYKMYGMGNSIGGDEYNYIDNTYVQYFVIFGIVATVALILCYVRICYKSYKQKILIIPLAVFISSLFGIITQFHFNVIYCPLLLATFSDLGNSEIQEGQELN